MLIQARTQQLLGSSRGCSIRHQRTHEKGHARGHHFGPAVRIADAVATLLIFQEVHRSADLPILFLQVFDRLELTAVDPASKQRQEELQRLDGAKHRRQYSELQLIERPRLKRAVRIVGYYGIRLY
jgi:hypothetical protein